MEKVWETPWLEASKPEGVIFKAIFIFGSQHWYIENRTTINLPQLAVVSKHPKPREHWVFFYSQRGSMEALSELATNLCGVVSFDLGVFVFITVIGLWGRGVRLHLKKCSWVKLKRKYSIRPTNGRNRGNTETNCAKWREHPLRGSAV